MWSQDGESWLSSRLGSAGNGDTFDLGRPGFCCFGVECLCIWLLCRLERVGSGRPWGMKNLASEEAEGLDKGRVGIFAGV